MFIEAKDPNAVVIVLPADHSILKKDKFHETLEIAVSAAGLDKLVTIGIKPIRPETEYGYIEVSDHVKGVKDVFLVNSFKEKPNETKAKQFCEAGNYLWNSGIFVWKATTILEAIKAYLPDLYDGLMIIKKNIGSKNLNSVIKDVYEKLEKVSIDHGVLEKASNVVVVKNKFDWDDLGVWTAMKRICPKDDRNNTIIHGDFLGVEADHNIVYTDQGIISVLGINDIIVVREKDAVLVCPRDRAKDVKEIIRQLREKGMGEYL
ncbi:mannose-1-phosphate guanylyltransferase [bacterium]|nr:mannose-1-phosphate guanylyltransferase [bacterium]